ncbi:MAG: dihydroorotase family protein [Candidatus Hydrothermarchaeota archaeon]
MLLKNCRIITPTDTIEADILIEGEKIARVGKALKDAEAIDLKGSPVIPGLVDVHVHMRDFQEGYKEDFASGSRAALVGGVTTFVDMPNSRPPVTDAATYRRRLAVAGAKSLVDFGLNYGITPESLEELDRVAPVAGKVYMDGALGAVSDVVLADSMRRCRRLAVHAEDQGVIEENLRRLGMGSFSDHARIRAPEAEREAVRRLSGLASSLERRVHICHVSSAATMRYMNEYVTCEVTPHHLLLTAQELERLGGIAKTNPPLRGKEDLAVLWEALIAGRIDIIASDHAPHAAGEKRGPPGDVPSGVPNLEVMLRLLLTQVKAGRMSLNTLVEKACENPARLFGIMGKGAVRPGMDADLLVLDMKAGGTIKAEEFVSKARYSPFQGWKTTGGVDKVFLRGRLAYDRGDILVEEGYGRPLGLL